MRKKEKRDLDTGPNMVLLAITAVALVYGTTQLAIKAFTDSTPFGFIALGGWLVMLTSFLVIRRFWPNIRWS